MTTTLEVVDDELDHDAITTAICLQADAWFAEAHPGVQAEPLERLRAWLDHEIAESGCPEDCGGVVRQVGDEWECTGCRWSS